MPQKLSKLDVLRYETQSSWWAGYISCPWLQRLARKYYAAKTERKYARLQRSLAASARIEALSKQGVMADVHVTTESSKPGMEQICYMDDQIHNPTLVWVPIGLFNQKEALRDYVHSHLTSYTPTP